MTKSLLVSFYADEYQKRTGNYRCLFLCFMRGIWKARDSFDQIYILDSGWNFSQQEMWDVNQDFLGKVIFEKMPEQSHWANMNTYFKEVHNDYILLVDYDTILYNPKAVQNGFKQLEADDCDAIGILDSSGSFKLGVPTILDKTDLRGERHRLCPYLSFFKRKSMEYIVPRFDPAEIFEGFKIPELKYEADKSDWTDSMGMMTLKMLAKGLKIKELPDDRSGVYILDDNTIRPEINLDAPEPNQPGYYHIRNWHGGLDLVDAYGTDRYAEVKQRVTRKEAMRLLAWLWTIAPEELHTKILPVVSDFGVPSGTWSQYLYAFRLFHSWLEEYV